MPAHDVVALRHAVTLLEGEAMLEGWAAERGGGGHASEGLLVVTTWRVIFIELTGGLSAFPIFKIDHLETDALSQLTLSVWYDRMPLTFDNPATARAVLNLLRQDPCWRATETVLTPRPASGQTGAPMPETWAAANDAPPTAVLAKVS